MSNPNIVIKLFKIIKYKGVLFLIGQVVKRVYFWFYEKKFSSASGIYLKKGFWIAGHKYISIGNNFRGGYSLRLEAILSYSGQKFNPVVTIGDNVFINDYVHIGCINSIEIGNNVLMASKIFISDHNHGYYGSDECDLHQSPEVPPAGRLLSENSSVFIGDNVWLGESVSVLAGSSIGRGSIIGANSVVSGRIPPFSIAVGSPAVVIKKYCNVSEVWKSVSLIP